ncbi:uncharacterized protein EV420DRAFT_542608 [Desarmillaria tabescens]|uniref:DUF6535 domain-containing protein n=1 Tax=Armillaria tabescens TaxID=1929756 RepID=A0AA39K9M9_ARMTA|nr:uncharacterized protein EV420DRAFT_542608 [Desarmillaria tabescens]KAK0457146.1 hypothetical protein EV420DRAFT_542608 [Desarmillaria tabescens]
MAMPSSEVENSTYYSSRRRRKSTRGLMGMRTREYLVKGNDPFDYEQKFSEDQRYEELGPAARVWRTYLEECVAFDIEMVEGWRDGLDVLLVFAGLFSAVVTTFVTQTSQSLQVNYSQVTASLLFELIDVTRAAANGSLVNNIPRSDLTPFSSFRPTTSDTWVNGLWFTSLSFSLATALFAVLTKQWIHQYIGASSGTPRERCHIRQFRYMGLQQWGVGLVIGLLPVLLSVSLGVFLVGLVIFLIPLQVSIASIVGVISFMSFAAYFVTNLLPIWYPSCSYKTPLSQYAFLLYTHITCHPFFVSAISRLWVPPPSVQTDESQDEPPESSSIRTLRDAERAVVEISADEMDVHALAWLFNMSTNPSVQSIIVQSTSALPLSSVEPLKQHAKGISDMCETFIWHMGCHPWQESIVDRLARASLRLVMDGEQSGLAWTLPDAEAGRERWSQDVYAEALAVVAYPGYPECVPTIRHLVETQFRPSEDKRLLLQPIVWGHLLQRLISSDLEDTLI